MNGQTDPIIVKILGVFPRVNFRLWQERGTGGMEQFFQVHLDVKLGEGDWNRLAAELEHEMPDGNKVFAILEPRLQYDTTDEVRARRAIAMIKAALGLQP